MEIKKKTNPAGAIKMIVAAGAVAGSVSLWSTFSAKAIEISNQKMAAKNTDSKVAEVVQPVVVNTPFQPDPTSTATSVPVLRAVNIDFAGKPAPVQPVVSRVVINIGPRAAPSTSSSSSSGSSSAPAPVTNTKTS
jgi:hypothetical protein